MKRPELLQIPFSPDTRPLQGALPSPFDEPPRHPWAKWAVEDLRRRLREQGELAPGVPTSKLEGQSGGTMLGVLVVRDPNTGEHGYLRAFAGQVDGEPMLLGWAPPLYDPSAYAACRVEGDAVLGDLEARRQTDGAERALEAAEARLAEARRNADAERERLSAAHRARRAERRAARAKLESKPSVASIEPEIRFDGGHHQRGLAVHGAHTNRSLTAETSLAALDSQPDLRDQERGHLPDATEREAHRSSSAEAASETQETAGKGDEPTRAAVMTLESLDQESRFENARFAEQKREISAALAPMEQEVSSRKRRVDAWRRLEQIASRRYLAAVQATYEIPTASGELADLQAVFHPGGAPGGAGDCAGAKLFGHALRLGLEPVALAETWWGAPPAGGGRVDGALYPACRAKCGPLLAFMLKGVPKAAPVRSGPGAPPASVVLPVLYEDESFVAIHKPPGLLSVPGRQTQDSALQRLRGSSAGPDVFSVHRLDQDASGVLLFAKTLAAQRWAQAELAGRRVHKIYVAELDGAVLEDEGELRLAFRLDPSDRPRQVYDPLQGKLGVTRWRVVSRTPERTRVELEPVTGRTHQLRCHAAHPLGLNAPIVGDRLYGTPAERLCLHARWMALALPSGERLELSAPPPF